VAADRVDDDACSSALSEREPEVREDARASSRASVADGGAETTACRREGAVSVRTTRARSRRPTRRCRDHNSALGDEPGGVGGVLLVGRGPCGAARDHSAFDRGRALPRSTNAAAVACYGATVELSPAWSEGRRPDGVRLSGSVP